MHGEFSIHGVFIPSLLGLMLLAFLLQSGLQWVLSRVGVYRHVWHPPLFNLALYVLVLGALFALLHGWQA
jgi:hypothetical protein